MGARKRELGDLTSRLGAAHARIAELERELERRAVRDELTGLANTRVFGRHLDEAINRSKRYGRPLSMALLRIDGFRDVAPRHGREAADGVLKAVASVVGDQTRGSDLVARLGDDEFGVMFPETEDDQAARCFERVLLELEVLHVGPVDCVAASIGIAGSRPGMTSGQLWSAAEDGLTTARARPGARVVIENGADEMTLQRERNQDAANGLVEALTQRDRYTGEHSESVVALAVCVGRGLALSDEEIEQVRMGALLHDIGKVAIPDEILHKPGGLDEDEWRVMRQHPEIGERILRAIPGYGAVARIVRHEHERFDGSGYPDGLGADQIPIGARIILACDAYHAMTSDRPYRVAMAHGEAIRELAQGAGTQFDPEVTEVLIGTLYGSRQMGAVASAPALAPAVVA
ncbi:MAG: diguanylate cyclase [Thermoleophilaceae bacterium]|nr:diguanylate cyclase [Thermoleophilaceae bacterium]